MKPVKQIIIGMSKIVFWSKEERQKSAQRFALKLKKGDAMVLFLKHNHKVNQTGCQAVIVGGKNLGEWDVVR